MIVASIALSYHAYLWLWLTGGHDAAAEADFFRFFFVIGSFPVMLGAAIPMLLTGQEPPASVYQGARRAGMPPLTRFGSLTWVLSWGALLFGRPDIAVTASLIGHMERGFVGLAEKQPRGFRRAVLEAPWRIAYLMNQQLLYPWLLLGGWAVSLLDRPRLRERLATLPDRETYLTDLEQRYRKAGNLLGLAQRLNQLEEYRRAQSVLLDAPPVMREAYTRGMSMDDLVALKENRPEDVIARLSGQEGLSPNQRAWLARAHVLAGNPQAALVMTQEKSARHDPRMRETAALAYSAMEDPAKAIDEMEAAYVLGAQGSARVLGQLGRRLLELGDPVEARVVLTRAVLSADFLDPAVVEDLASALSQLGRAKEAEAVRSALEAR